MIMNCMYIQHSLVLQPFCMTLKEQYNHQNHINTGTSGRLGIVLSRYLNFLILLDENHGLIFTLTNILNLIYFNKFF